MIEFYKTYDNVTKKISTPEIGCWINVVSPNEEEKNFSKGFWTFENPNYWNLNHPYLDKLKAFLRSSCSW